MSKKRVSKRDRFMTGYKNPALVKAAKQNGGGKGAQKKKRDKLAYETKYNIGGRVRIGKADKATGVFLGPDSGASDAYKKEIYRIGEGGKKQHQFRNKPQAGY